MPNLTDYRTKPIEELTFYVFDNLRVQDMPQGTTIYRYDTIEEAVNKFQELPNNWTTAIGCSFEGKHELDLVHRVNGEAVKIMDFYFIEVFVEREDVHKAMEQLVNELSIQKQFASGIHPRRTVLTELSDPEIKEGHLNNKVIFVPESRRSHSLYAGINEVYVEGEGWMDMKEFLDKYPDSTYENPYAPTVTQVNVQYKEVDSGRTGQCDVRASSMREFMQKSHIYQQEIEKKKRESQNRVKEGSQKEMER